MNLFSSSPTSNSNFNLLTQTQNPHSRKFCFTFPLKTLHSPPSHHALPPICSLESSSSASSSSSPLLQEKPQTLEENGAENNEEIKNEQKSFGESLVVRRPMMEYSEEEGEEDRKYDSSSEYLKKENDGGEERASYLSSSIDAGLTNFAKKVPIFEPGRVDSSAEDKPLQVNLDLALYKAKVLTRNFRYEEAEKILQLCICYWPEDGRPYVALGKTFSKQGKMNEARAVYEKGCQATQGENSFIWQCWAVLESKMGNVRRARELFDAATVADKKHVAAWHGWAVLELKQGNIKKARHLLGKGLKYCGGNEYIYQTLARLEAKAGRYERACYLFRQATKCNPRSCASWLSWAQLEAQQENNSNARGLFEKAVQASHKNRFAWHVWGVFEATLGNVDLARKLLKIGHAVNPRDPVLLQSLGLLEYKYSTANVARALFRRASQLDPKHQPVWIAWGWMEWKEGNIAKARELYQRALSINSSTDSAARCLQAWGVLEQRAGNISAARRLFRSSLNVNSQSYITWMTWASLEEGQGNSIRAEEIRNLYFQQRTEVVDDESWIMGFLDIIDPAIDSIKRLLNFDQNSYTKDQSSTSAANKEVSKEESGGTSGDARISNTPTGFNLDDFIREKLSLDPLKLDVQLEVSLGIASDNNRATRKVWQSAKRSAATSA